MERVKLKIINIYVPEPEFCL